MRKIFVAVITLAFVCINASALYAEQSTKEKLRSLIEGLNDPDPIIRLATFEDAVKSNDAVMKQVALRTALQGTDIDMRALAVRGAFVDKGVLVLKLSENDELKAALESAGDDKEKKQQVYKKFRNSLAGLDESARAISIEIDKYDFNTGNFSGFCMNGIEKRNESYKVSGNVSGDTLSMQASCHFDGGHNLVQCAVQAKASTTGRMLGTIHCSYGMGNSNVEFDVL